MANLRKKGRITSLLLAGVMIFSLLLSLTGCFEGNESVIVNTEINELGELIVYYSDGTTHNAGIIENNETNIHIDGGNNTVSVATAKGLMSAVSITSNFVSKTQSYIPGFGIVGGSGNKYYSRGSGVIYRINGDEALIITNHHVVYDSGSSSKDGISTDIELYLYGREASQYAISAEYVGGSEYYDIAVLYAKDAAFKSSAVAAASVSFDGVSVGQNAIAVGNPQGYGISASSGIVSVESEYISTGSVSSSTRVIRVDTAVNAGNSGGGLYNCSGDLIGIVNAKIVDESVEGIGYAIPSSVAIGVCDNIIRNCLGNDNKYVKRAMLGITLNSSDSCAVVNEKGEIEIVETVFVSAVERGSISDGVVSKGDILMSATLGERTVEITRTYHIIDLMLYASVGDEIALTINRGGEILTKTVKITDRAISNY